MRGFFTPRRRLAARSGRPKVSIDPPRSCPAPSRSRRSEKALPFVFGAAIVGMMVMMFISGIRQMNPMYLFFMAMMALGLFQSVQTQGAAPPK